MDEYTRLKKDNARLVAENDRLKAIEKLYRSLLMELKIQGYMPGSTLTAVTDPNGDVVKIEGDRVEVKFSSNVAKHGDYHMWSWRKINGRKGKKQYEQLLLIGEFNGSYKYFLIPKKSIPKKLMINEADGTISIRLRYSFADWSVFQKYLSKFESRPIDL